MKSGPKVPESLGDFETVRLLGRGGMGFVLEVRSRTTGVHYAAKLLNTAGSEVARDRFRREAELAARCDRHPGIVKVHSFGETPDGTLYLIMDLVTGEGLDQVIAREGRLAPRRAAELTRDIARALGHAHKLGITHRDVKPANILIDATGPRVTDFGLATAADVERLTATGTWLGTPRYLAPERALFASPGDARSDVFSLGCVLYQLITGSPPLGDAGTTLHIVYLLEQPEPFPDVRKNEPSCPEMLAMIVSCAIAKKPDQRYADAAEMAQDLDRYLIGLRTTRVPAATVLTSRSLAWRVLPAFLGVCLLGVVLALVSSMNAHARERRAAEAITTAQELLRSAKSTAREADATAALAQARVAYERAHECGGVKDGARLETTATTTLALASALLAEASLAKDPEHALALLGEVPGAPGSLPPEVRLVHARGLLGLGQLDAAEAEVASVLSSSAASSRSTPGNATSGSPTSGHSSSTPAGSARRPEALELMGDILLARGALDRAEAAYSAALEASPRAELRIKRATVATRAQDDHTALADLALLVPELPALGLRRASNARFAELAPALYRRALAADSATGARDLEAAWRLAPPPTPIATRVAHLWLTVAEQQIQALGPDYFVEQDEEKILRALKPLELVARAHEADPVADSDALWYFFETYWAWARRTAEAPLTDRVVRAYLAVLPDEPVVLLVDACVRGKYPLQRERQRADLERAIDRLRPLHPGSHRMAERTVYELGNGLAEIDGTDQREADTTRLHRCAAITGVEDDDWLFLSCYLEFGINKASEAFEALGHVGRVGNERVPREEHRLRRQVSLLLRLHRPEEAAAIVKACPGQLEQPVRDAAMSMCDSMRPSANSAPVSEEAREGWLVAGKEYALLGDLAKAETVLTMLTRLDGARAAELKGVIESQRH